MFEHYKEGIRQEIQFYLQLHNVRVTDWYSPIVLPESATLAGVLHPFVQQEDLAKARERSMAARDGLAIRIINGLEVLSDKARAAIYNVGIVTVQVENNKDLTIAAHQKWTLKRALFATEPSVRLDTSVVDVDKTMEYHSGRTYKGR